MKSNTKLTKLIDAAAEIDLFEIFQENMYTAFVEDSEWADILECSYDVGKEAQKTGVEATYVILENTIFIFCLSTEKEDELIKEIEEARSNAK